MFLSKLTYPNTCFLKNLHRLPVHAARSYTWHRSRCCVHRQVRRIGKQRKSGNRSEQEISFSPLINQDVVNLLIDEISRRTAADGSSPQKCPRSRHLHSRLDARVYQRLPCVFTVDDRTLNAISRAPGWTTFESVSSESEGGVKAPESVSWPPPDDGSKTCHIS
jgi:hypothetical protein